MSKIVQKLKELSRVAQPAIGFRPAAAVEPAPQMLVVVRLAEMSKDAASTLAAASGAGADAAIVPAHEASTKTLKALLKEAGDMPVGLSFQGVDSDRAADLSETGFDFLVFGMDAAATILEAKDAGKVLQVGHGAGLEQLRAVGELEPVIDGVLVTGHSDGFVPIEHVLTFRRLARVLARPLWAEVPAGISATDLKSVWEAGVDVIVLGGAPAAGEIGKLKEMIAALPRGGRRQWGGRPSPALPRVAESRSVETPEEEEEGEE